MFNRLKRESVIRYMAQAWILTLVVGSLQLARPVALARHRPDGPVVAAHRALHFLAFSGATLLLLLASRTRRQKLQSAGFTLLLGLTLEWLQHLIYHNEMEWHDVRDDALATLLALLLYWLASIFRSAVANAGRAGKSETANPGGAAM